MKITYFQNTDTLYIQFREVDVAETRDLDDNTLLDFDGVGNMCAMTFEHAKDRVDIKNCSFEQVLTGLAAPM